MLTHMLSSWSLYQMGMTGCDTCTLRAVVITGCQLSDIKRNWYVCPLPMLFSNLTFHSVRGCWTSRPNCSSLFWPTWTIMTSRDWQSPHDSYVTCCYQSTCAGVV